MKKAMFLATILLISVLSTACINNLAVQELNNKALAYMKEGKYEEAISRLKSSSDLDSTIFETQYNLANAYTENEDYKDAIETYEKALQLNPDSADCYYSRAVAYENYAKDLYAGNTKEQKEAFKDADDETALKNAQKDLDKYEPTKDELERVKSYYESSINDYEKYLELSQNSNDAAEVQSKIQELNDKLTTLDSDSN